MRYRTRAGIILWEGEKTLRYHPHCSRQKRAELRWAAANILTPLSVA